MRLHELPTTQRKIDEMLDESGGEITPEIETLMATLQEELHAKVDWVGTVIAERLAKADAYKAEADRLNALRKQQEAAAESLKAYLKLIMETMGHKKAEGDLFKASLQTAGKPRIVWTKDYEKLPEEYRRVTITLDGDAAHEAYAQGCLPDGFLATFTTSLRIR